MGKSVVLGEIDSPGQRSKKIFVAVVHKDRPKSAYPTYLCLLVTLELIA